MKPAIGVSAGIEMHFWKRLFSRENLWALVLCLIFIALTIFSAEISPAWIYQGF